MSEQVVNIPDGWKLATLGEICDIDPETLSSSTPGSYSFRYIDIASVSPNRISNQLSLEQFSSAPSRARKKVRANDVLMATVRPNLKAFTKVQETGEFVASTGFAVLRAIDGESHPEFLKQLIFSDAIEQQIDSLVAGSNYPAITVSNVKRLQVLAPTFTEQESIAEVLSALDEQIEATEALVVKLTQRRKGLVQENLLPVAQAASTVTLGNVCSVITSGSRGWAQYYAPEGDLFLRIGNLTRAHPNLRFDDVVRVRPPSGGEGERTKLEAGDLLISITADLGIIGCIPNNLGAAYINQHIALARINDPELEPRWVAHVLASPFGFDQISKLNDGGAKAGLNLPTINALRVPKPSLVTQKELAALLDAADEEIASEQALAVKLRLQKQGLMRDLLTGKTRVLL